MREILYGRAGAPRIIGKKDATGRLLIPAGGELTAGRLLAPLRRVLNDRLELKKPPPPALSLEVLPAKRAAYFCSGCPHNRSTAVPEGSLAGGGIGCHTMVTMSGRTDSAVTGLTQMGGEGSQWIGQAPFTDVPAPVPEHRRRNLLPLRPTRGAGLRRGRREHHLQAALQRGRGDDRRPGRRGRTDRRAADSQTDRRRRASRSSSAPTNRSGTTSVPSPRAPSSGTATASTTPRRDCATSRA